MPTAGFTEEPNQIGGAGRGDGSCRVQGTTADGRETASEAVPRRAGTASCKMCLHADVCKAREAAMLVNMQFAGMRFINMDTPIIVPDLLAERCAKYTPPNRAEMAEAIKHEFR